MTTRLLAVPEVGLISGRPFGSPPTCAGCGGVIDPAEEYYVLTPVAARRRSVEGGPFSDNRSDCPGHSAGPSAGQISRSGSWFRWSRGVNVIPSSIPRTGAEQSDCADEVDVLTPSEQGERHQTDAADHP